MSAKILDEQSKLAAVGEVLAGLGTLSSVARRHGISIGYLSILASRARRAVESKSVLSNNPASRDAERAMVEKLSERVQMLEKKFNRLFK